MEIRIFDTPYETARAFAEYMLEMHQKNGKLNIALSGGSTPKILFDLLANEFQNDFRWDQINFYWGDERCVPPTDDESNYKMTWEHLLCKVDIPEKNVHRIKGEEEPSEEAQRYDNLIENNLPSEDDNPVFDIVLLGMGTDGHTASIFPHEIELLDSTANCEVATHPDSGQKRITLTGPVINQAKAICFLVTGDNKKEKIDQIIQGTELAKNYPAFHINAKKGELIWFIDEAAGALLG